MNKIETLIKELCPNGVEWKELGNICTVKTGKGINKNFIQANPGEFPVVNSGKDPLGFVNIFNTVDDPIGITSRGAGVGYVSWNEGNYFRGNLNYSATIKDKSKLSARFLYFYLKNNSVEIEKLCTFNGIPALNKENLEKLTIPVPPLEIQEEIVKILDKFTDYVTELTTELTLRQKQYNYYRDKLLFFENEDIEWMLMPEVAKDFGRGKSKHRPRNDSKLYGGTIPFVQTGDIRNSKGHITDYSQTYSDFGLKQSKIWGKGTLCITIAANIAEMGILDFDACFPDSVVGFIANEEIVMTKFVAYYLESIKEVLASKSTGSAQENLNLASFSNLKIPVPSLERQLTIVKFLDNFDTICNDIYQGLPKEIELRQKQYEYYRDKLLTFD
ncbi:restriction endonuclease subunit S [Streptococcus parauberis]|uniref:Restriction endonuclease subunit S n=1 Tax=Streptococcus parauberis TaxID=1348 RepID=A0AAE4KV69_9STRE|nr:restriction endonuclease subunit S [Streptococcus parauberis]MDT2732541.1 restriction endonuclease subunit S [Streptococcus parauberis]